MREWVIDQVKCPHCGVLNAAKTSKPRVPEPQLLTFRCWNPALKENKGEGCLKDIWLMMYFAVEVLPKDYDSKKSLNENLKTLIKHEKPSEQPSIFE